MHVTARCTNVVGRLHNEMVALAVIFGVLEEERVKWRRVAIKPQDVAWVEQAVSPLGDQSIWTKLMEAIAV